MKTLIRGGLHSNTGRVLNPAGDHAEEMITAPDPRSLQSSGSLWA